MPHPAPFAALVGERQQVDAVGVSSVGNDQSHANKAQAGSREEVQRRMNDEEELVVSVERKPVVHDRMEFSLSDGATGDEGETNDGN
jgi:hypothetical protein